MRPVSRSVAQADKIRLNRCLHTSCLGTSILKSLLPYRWYGAEDPKTCFVERKTHRESWKGEESVKERFTLPEQKMVPFLEGEYTLETAVQDLRAKVCSSNISWAVHRQGSWHAELQKDLRSPHLCSMSNASLLSDGLVRSCEDILSCGGRQILGNILKPSGLPEGLMRSCAC